MGQLQVFVMLLGKKKGEGRVFKAEGSGTEQMLYSNCEICFGLWSSPVDGKKIEWKIERKNKLKRRIRRQLEENSVLSAPTVLFWILW